MARIHDLLAALTPEQTGLLPEGFVAEVTAEYDNDLSIREAAITERENRIEAAKATIAEKDAESIALKAANWDMLQAIPANKQEPEDDDDDDEPGDDSDEDIFGN